MRAKPSPESFGFALWIGPGDKVLLLGPAATHADVDQVVSPPHRVYASRAARNLIVGPVSETEERWYLQVAHCPDGTGPHTGAGTTAEAKLSGSRKAAEADAGSSAGPRGPRAVKEHRESGIVTEVESPGTYRISDGSRVEFSAAVAAWTTAALPVLERVARTYHATITYQELGEEVQQITGIHTRMLLMHWIGQVLGGASRESHRRGQPMLSALCVHSDGTVGIGYSQAIMDNYGGPLPADLDMHAAEERLRCYQYFGANLPPGGGKPALTPQVAARRVWLTRQARGATPDQPYCPICNLMLPVSGICDNCG